MSQYSNREPPVCKYCSTDKNKTLIRFKKNELGKWVVFNMDGSEHNRQYCDEIKRRNQTQPQQVSVFPHQEQQQLQTQQAMRGGEEPPSGITPYSSYILASDTRKEVREVKKQVQTLTDIVDSMAQKIELILKQTGYPKPEPILNEEEGKALVEMGLKQVGEHLSKEEEDDVRANPGFTEFLDNKNKKALEEANNNIAEKQREDNLLTEDGKSIDMGKVVSRLDEVEANQKDEVINPYRLPKMEEEPPTQTDGGWTPISQKFECHSCNGFKHNGYEKYGTRVCLDCKEGIDAQNL